MNGIALHITRRFPLLALLASAYALFFPAGLMELKPAITPLLGLVMLSMGVSLTPADFTRIFRRPWVILLGVMLQYLLMPLFAYLVARLFDLPLELTVGMLLVGASPGGTASNVICYLGRGDLPLSVTLTTVSTLLAVFLTPLMTWFYVGEQVPVPVASMLQSILYVIVVPVAAGMLLNRWLGRRLESIQAYLPVFAVLCIVLIIAIVVALNHARFATLVMSVVLAVMLHNGLGLAGGYLVARALRLDPVTARTLAIETGMQNSGLAAALALKYFTAAAALPAAVFSIWHNLSGATLAAYWARTAPADTGSDPERES